MGTERIKDPSEIGKWIRFHADVEKIGSSISKNDFSFDNVNFQVQYNNGNKELGEKVEETGIREVREETGLIVYDLKLFNVYSGESQYHKYPDGNEFYFVNIVFMTKAYDGILTIDEDETKELAFFELGALPSNMSKTNIPIMEDLKSHQRRFDLSSKCILDIIL